MHSSDDVVLQHQPSEGPPVPEITDIMSVEESGEWGSIQMELLHLADREAGLGFRLSAIASRALARFIEGSSWTWAPNKYGEPGNFLIPADPAFRTRLGEYLHLFAGYGHTHFRLDLPTGSVKGMSAFVLTRKVDRDHDFPDRCVGLLPVGSPTIPTILAALPALKLTFVP